MHSEPITGLPPGPRLPRWMQTAGFIFQPSRFIDGCRRRYGDVVTFRSLFDPCFVMVFDPEIAKQVFRGSPDRLRAGEANAVLGPVVGARSVLLLDGAEHLRERKLLLPPFHGERMRAYERVMTEAADRAIDSWPVGREFTLLPSLRSLTLDVILRAVFGVDEGPRLEELKRRIRAMIDPTSSRLGLIALALSGGRFGSGARAALRRPPRRGGRADLRGDRPAPRRPGPGGARGRVLDAAARPRRGRPGDDRRGAARRARHPARGRARDHGHRARLGVRAAAAQPRRSRARRARATAPISTRW